MRGQFRMRFLGTGSATSTSLGSASAVLEASDTPILLIDCGPSTPERYQRQYSSLPVAIFITHAHFDHIGGLESLFYLCHFGKHVPRLFVPAPLIPMLYSRLGEFPGLAEGGANFFDTFQLVPVGSQFFWRGLKFSVFPVRHHAPNSAFGIALCGHFVFSGDTRPIPETVAHFGSGGEQVFHDCTLSSNPSHTGAQDLLREYPSNILERTWLYHQRDIAEAQAISDLGLNVLYPDSVVDLGHAELK